MSSALPIFFTLIFDGERFRGCLWIVATWETLTTLQSYVISPPFLPLCLRSLPSSFCSQQQQCYLNTFSQGSNCLLPAQNAGYWLVIKSYLGCKVCSSWVIKSMMKWQKVNKLPVLLLLRSASPIRGVATPVLPNHPIRRIHLYLHACFGRHFTPDALPDATLTFTQAWDWHRQYNSLYLSCGCFKEVTNTCKLSLHAILKTLYRANW